MSGNHDLGYKQLFAHPEMVRDLLSGFTPLECFRELDAGAFERVNASYVSEQFSERHGDMVWRVRLADHTIYVYLLLEFQSQAERWMALRMQVYVGLLYQDLVKRRELSDRANLPPVLPVVFYNGKAPWSASAELSQLVADSPSELKQFQASQRYLLIDQHGIDPAELAAARNLVAALFRLELSDDADVLMEIIATLSVWLAGTEQAPLRRSIASWINRLRERESPRLGISDVLTLLEDETMGERFQRKYATWEDAIEDRGRQKGREEGREQGREEGREEGRAQAMRLVLKKLLVERFGTLPVAVAARIDQANDAEAEQWIERVIGAENIDAVLRG